MRQASNNISNDQFQNLKRDIIPLIQSLKNKAEDGKELEKALNLTLASSGMYRNSKNNVSNTILTIVDQIRNYYNNTYSDQAQQDFIINLIKSELEVFGKDESEQDRSLIYLKHPTSRVQGIVATNFSISNILSNYTGENQIIRYEDGRVIVNQDDGLFMTIDQAKSEEAAKDRLKSGGAIAIGGNIVGGAIAAAMFITGVGAPLAPFVYATIAGGSALVGTAVVAKDAMENAAAAFVNFILRSFGHSGTLISNSIQTCYKDNIMSHLNQALDKFQNNDRLSEKEKIMMFDQMSANLKLMLTKGSPQINKLNGSVEDDIQNSFLLAIYNFNLLYKDLTDKRSNQIIGYETRTKINQHSKADEIMEKMAKAITISFVSTIDIIQKNMENRKKITVNMAKEKGCAIM